MRQGYQVISDGPARNIHEAAFKGPVLLDGPLPGKPPIDVVVRSEHRGDPTKDFRLMLLDPSQFWGNQLLIQSVPGSHHKCGGIDLPSEILNFRSAARITLLNAGTK